MQICVLDIAIEQINQYSDYKIEYEQHKQGRTIIGFSFKFKSKSKEKTKNAIDVKRDSYTPDLFVKLTDSQRFHFAKKLSQMHEMSEYSQGTEDYQQFALRIADMLLDPEKIKELSPFLKKAGFLVR